MGDSAGAFKQRIIVVYCRWQQGAIYKAMIPMAWLLRLVAGWLEPLGDHL
jgi:hypothetical protein